MSFPSSICLSSMAFSLGDTDDMVVNRHNGGRTCTPEGTIQHNICTSTVFHRLLHHLNATTL